MSVKRSKCISSSCRHEQGRKLTRDEPTNIESRGVTPNPPFLIPSFPRNPGSKFAHNELLISDGDALSSPSWRNCKNDRDIVSEAGPSASSYQLPPKASRDCERTHPIRNHQDDLNLWSSPPKASPQAQQLLPTSISLGPPPAFHSHTHLGNPISPHQQRHQTPHNDPPIPPPPPPPSARKHLLPRRHHDSRARFLQDGGVRATEEGFSLGRRVRPVFWG